MSNEKFHLTGKVTAVKAVNSGVFFTIATKEKNKREFWAYPPNTNKPINVGDTVTFQYHEQVGRDKKSGKDKIFNKIDYFYIPNYQPSKQETTIKEKDMSKQILSGTITSINNVRGYSAKKKGEVAFTVKTGRGEKVAYCYAPKALTKSSFFKKSQPVSLEVTSESPVNKHRAYSVITLWERN